MPNLYAFLVAVNEYPNLDQDLWLSGPINDIQKITDYLQQDFVKASFKEIHLHKLSRPVAADAELPTKVNIIKGFTKFLSQAQAGDTVLFYYSGHGAREQTNWLSFQHEEIDGHITNITAYDFQVPKTPTSQGNAMLSDKELRYLIYPLAHHEDGQPKAHVLAIFDSCHSGEGTRGLRQIESSGRFRQVDHRTLPARNDNEFVFFDDSPFFNKQKQAAPLQTILPLGDHVMLAACREVELAWERLGRDHSFGGVFTSALLEVLYAYKGQISYHDLHSRVLNRMRFYYFDSDRFDYRQTPQLFLQAPSTQARYHAFLTNAPMEQNIHCPLDFMPKEKEWRLGLGAMHGLSPDQFKHPNRVRAWALDNPNTSWEVQIGSVFPTYSLLIWPNEVLPDVTKTYAAKVEGLSLPSIAIFLSGDPEGRALAHNRLLELLSNADSASFNLVENEADADYVLHAQQGTWYLGLPFDRRPLLLPVRYVENGMPNALNADVLYRYFKQMAKWHYLKNLEYFAPSATQSTPLPDYPIELKVFKKLPGGLEKRIYPVNGQFYIELSTVEPTWHLRFELLNHSDDILFCSLPYLSYHFGFSSNKIMMRAQHGLSPGEPFRSNRYKGQDYIPVGIDRYTQQFHWPGESNYLKLIYSTTQLALESFDMDGLPRPGDKGLASAKGAPAPDDTAPSPCPDWEIRTFGFYIVNPFFNPLESKNLSSAIPTLDA